ncbi:CYTH domain-containing protein [Thalassotalea aquiviva]|uniref:CYTH domain-containing protein n=1 Tax=Thalassotalea aquiviva TaxID=3242415 RepID=UPI00352B6CDE
MDTEIELKYLVLGDNIPTQITKLLTDNAVRFEYHTDTLSNRYFDTCDSTLRQHDIGLRVRKGSSGLWEQTVKTSGTVLAGMHTRPEYNVDICRDHPDLTLFDRQIWPQDFVLEQVNSQLSCLFETNFTRHSWLINNADNSQFELVYDTGAIVANEQNEQIAEIELELKQGQVEVLFDFAEILMANFAIRPGSYSKAARGYALAQGKSLHAGVESKALLKMDPSMELLESFNSGFAQSLTRLQVLVDKYIQSPNLETLTDVSDMLALARHGLWLYADYLTDANGQILRQQINGILQELSWVETAKQIRELTTKNGHYRKKIEYSQSLLAELKDEKHAIVDYQKARDLFHSERFNQMQLSMLKMILKKSPFDGDIPHLSDFAPSWLSLSLKNVTQALQVSDTLTANDYLENHRLVTRCLLTGSWFGSLFEEEQRIDFRGPWMDLHLGIDELETLQLLKEHLQRSSEQTPVKLINWLDHKVDNLLCALEHCKDAALSLTPYWLK